ncbi:cytoplasmic 60S subunit biogenesis factor ZNF622 [Linepithema humile]|uniref:cytoplasmic 60S subunit biogenesis factor ZNF622 n=1 Tax=Linepithema humile TaxID=83485 RepID=UPI00351F41BD
MATSTYSSWTYIELCKEPFQHIFYNCRSCGVIFQTCEAHRQHFHSKWHIYNLNRKVNQLPRVTQEEFEIKEESYRTTDETKKTFYCVLCGKKYNCEKQYKNHLTTNKHKKNMQKNAVDLSSAEKLTEMENEYKEKPRNSFAANSIKSETNLPEQWHKMFEVTPDHYCLFCSNRYDTIFHNLSHMKMKHSFYIPDEEYCSNIKNLINYLSQKIRLEYKCLWCNDSGRQLRSAEAARAHMIDKGHCKMLFEGETILEYMRFYNYSSSYPDWEDSDVDSDEELPSGDFLDDEGYELVLPSGKTVGHRTLVRYYKQYYHAYPTRRKRNNTITLVEKNRDMKYNSLGIKELLVPSAMEKRRRDIRYIENIYRKYSTKLEIKQNKLQKHFRSQTNVY